MERKLETVSGDAAPDFNCRSLRIYSLGFPMLISMNLALTSNHKAMEVWMFQWQLSYTKCTSEQNEHNELGNGRVRLILTARCISDKLPPTTRIQI